MHKFLVEPMIIITLLCIMVMNLDIFFFRWHLWVKLTQKACIFISFVGVTTDQEKYENRLAFTNNFFFLERFSDLPCRGNVMWKNGGCFISGWSSSGWVFWYNAEGLLKSRVTYMVSKVRGHRQIKGHTEVSPTTFNSL